jgi:hypothetical protein
MSGPILFEITAADSHLQIVLPVIRVLRQRGIPAVVFSNCELNRKTSDVAPLEREQIPYVRLVETPLPIDELSYQRLAVPIFRRIPDEIRKHHPPLIIVLNDRNSPSWNFVQAGRKLGIPVLMLQESLRKDLFQRPSMRKLYFRWRRKILTGIEAGLFHYGQGGCDHLTAWGGFSRDYFLRVGVKPERITITGNPRFDVFARPDFDREAAAIRSQYALPEDTFLLTFLSSPIEKMHIVSPEEKKEALGRMLDWIRNLRAQPDFSSLQLAVKLHRAENVPWFTRFLHEQNATDFAFLADQPLYPLLWASQASLMFSTTAGLEAALLRRPVAMLELSKPLDDWNFTGRGVAQRVASQEDLAAYVRLVREDAAFAGRCEAAAHYYLDHIGQAAENVAELVERLAGKPGPQTPR